ncbi:MAG: hypothetical protein WBO36_14245 [Saprospiraceae bacterium]
MICISKIVHKEGTRILLRFNKDEQIASLIKSLEGVSYSKTYTGWHLPYTKETWNGFLKLNLIYTIEDTGTTGSAMPISENTGTTIADVPPHCTEQAADTIVGSIRYMHPYFYVRGINAIQSIGIKNIPGVYWNQRYENWVIPANHGALSSLWTDVRIISEERYHHWEKLIGQVNNPPTCILYSSPELPDHVLLQLTGYNVDVDFLKHIPERSYDKNGKYWLIPSNPDIVLRITDHYKAKNTKIISRIKLEYLERKEPTYAEYKKYLLSKSTDGIQYATLPYLDKLITKRYSISTIREYYSRFSKFAIDILPLKCDEIDVTKINDFLCRISEAKGV